MRKLTKRLGTGAIVVSMLLSSSMMAFAADPAGTGSSRGTGEIEGVVDTDVYSAVLPTESETAYKYIADPQGLIRKTNAVKYENKKFGEGTIFFANTDGEFDYSDTSDAAKIVNQSAKNLSVKVTAKATPGSSGATLASAKTFTGTDKEVYLGIKGSKEGDTESALTADGVEKTVILGAAPGEAFEYKYDSDTGKYSYSVKSDLSSFNFAEYSFQISGAANDKATWEETTALPEIEVTWEVDLTDTDADIATPEQISTPHIATTSYTLEADTPVNINVSLGAGDKAATKISAIMNGSTALPSDSWTYSEGVLTITAARVNSLVNANVSKTYTVVFNDTAKTKINITLDGTH